MSKSQKKPLNRDFAPQVLDRAEKIAEEYQIVIAFEDGEYYGRGLELPGAMDDGKTPDECVEKTRKAMIGMVAFMLERGEIPPAPVSRAERKIQVNVRMTADEKLKIEEAAKEKGFNGISDYIRSAAMAGTK